MSTEYRLWHDLYKKRRDWRVNAEKRIISRLHYKEASKEVEELIGSDGIVISFYGRPQIGKTTCILYMLGVRIEKIVEVSELIRGSQKHSESATSTATQYKKSLDKPESYGIKIDSNEPRFYEKEQDFIKAMDHIRECICSSPGAIRFITIYIPQRYFRSEKVNLNIIDLPGDGSKNDKEQEHVRLIIPEYIKRSQIVFVLEEINTMTSLGKIKIKGVYDWKDDERFKIMLTRTYSDSKTRSLLESQEVARGTEDFLSEIRNYVGGKVHQDIRCKDISNTRIYPMDLGASLDSLKKGYQRMVIDCNEQMREQLIVELESESKRIMRGGFVDQMKGKITNNHRYVIGEWEEKKRNLDEEKTSFINQCNNRKEIHKKASMELDSLKSQHSNIEKQLNGQREFSTEYNEEIEKIWTDLKECIIKKSDEEYKSITADQRPEFFRWICEEYFDRIIKYLEEKFPDCGKNHWMKTRNLLEEEVSEEDFFKKKRIVHKWKLNMSYMDTEGYTIFLKIIRKRYDSVFNEKKISLRQEKNRICSRMNKRKAQEQKFREYYEQTEKKIRHVEKEMAAVEVQKEQEEKRYSEDIEIIDSYLEIAEGEFWKQYEDAFQKCKGSCGDVKLIWLLYCQLLSNEYAGFVEGEKICLQMN